MILKNNKQPLIVNEIIEIMLESFLVLIHQFQLMACPSTLYGTFGQPYIYKSHTFQVVVSLILHNKYYSY